MMFFSDGGLRYVILGFLGKVDVNMDLYITGTNIYEAFFWSWYVEHYM